MENLLAILFLIEFFVTIYGVIFFIGKYNTLEILPNIKDIFVSLFKNKNLFGIFLSCILVVIFLPCFILLCMLQLILWLCILAYYVWTLGIKEKEESKE